MVTETTITFASQVAALEPLSGAALAISLAYLTLDRFRYRTKIQSHSADILQECVKNFDEVAHTTAFGSLTWLANADAPSGCRKACVDARARGLKLKDKPPFGFKSTCYLIFFRKPTSEFIVMFLSVVAFFTLTSGVLINAQIWDSFSINVISLLSVRVIICLLLFGCVLPGIFVSLGRLCVDWGIEFSNEMGDELKITIAAIERKAEGLQNEVQSVTPPDIE